MELTKGTRPQEGEELKRKSDETQVDTAGGDRVIRVEERKQTTQNLHNKTKLNSQSSRKLCFLVSLWSSLKPRIFRKCICIYYVVEISRDRQQRHIGCFLFLTSRDFNENSIQHPGTQREAAGISQHAGRRGNGGSASPAQLPQRRLYLFTRQTVLLGDTSGEMQINGALLLLPLGSHQVIVPPSQPPPVLWNSTCEEKLLNIKQVGRRLPLPSAAKVILMFYFFLCA